MLVLYTLSSDSSIQYRSEELTIRGVSPIAVKQRTPEVSTMTKTARVAAIMTWLFLCEGGDLFAGDFHLVQRANAVTLKSKQRSIDVRTMIPEFINSTTEERRQLLCLAVNIYHEASVTDEQDGWAVGFVTINRLQDGRWGDTICQVIGARSQFGWVRGSLTTKVGTEFASPDFQRWERAQRIAYLILNDTDLPDVTDGRMFFWNRRTDNPPWKRAAYDLMRIGVHVYARVH